MLTYFDLDLIIQGVLAALMAVFFLFQLVTLLSRQNKLNKFTQADELPILDIPVSVIISARNEAENLKKLVPNLMLQLYPQYELIIVNDCSIDESKWVLEELQAQYPSLKIVTVTESRNYKTGKKFAITMGIKAAKYNCLLFTDADCIPASENWISRMAEHFRDPQNQIVLGYSPYYKTKGFLNSIIRFETIKTAINYLSAALKGNAYMGVGRNLAYRKEFFFNNKGFASHMHIMSGDDDLFVNETATEYNTTIELHPDSFIFSEPKTSVGAWFKQKRRHMGAGKFYKVRHKRMLGTDAFTGLFFYVLFFACLPFEYARFAAISLFLIRLICQMLVYNKQFKRLEGKDLRWFLPFYDLIYYLHLNVFGLIGMFTKTKQWK